MRTWLKWVDKNYGASEIRVYHGTAALDTQNLPAPLAVLGPKVTEYYHENIDLNSNHHYLVAALVNGAEYFSPEVMVESSQNPIATFFALGERGWWYDPSDLGTMYQDARGTVPVTADGDPVRRLLDKSGNGIHLTAPSTGLVYRTNGTHHWLEVGGGAGNYLIASGSRPLTKFAHETGGGYTGCYGVRYGNVAAPNAIYVLWSNSGATSSRIGATTGWESRDSTSPRFTPRQWVGRGTTPAVIDILGQSNALLANTDAVYSEIVTPSETSANRHRFRVAGGTDYLTNPTTGSPTTSEATDELNLGRASTGTANMVGRIYQIVVVQGQLGATQRAQLEAAVSAKTP